MKFMTFLVMTSVLGAAASADPGSTKVRSGAYVEMIAQRGLDCGLLTRWQSLSLRALSLEDRRDWAAEDVEALKRETAKLVSETGCDADSLTVWIEASRKGFDAEMLPPYLVAYKTLAEMDTPPHVFSATALRLDKAPVLAAIDGKLAELASSGRPAEGGKPWPEYIISTQDAVLEFASALETAEGDRAGAWLSQSARIVEVWYDETHTDGGIE